MKFIRQILYVLLLIIPALPASAQEEGEKKGVDLQEVLWGHIKDAYHWHIMDIGGEPVVIHLPVNPDPSDSISPAERPIPIRFAKWSTDRK